MDRMAHKLSDKASRAADKVGHKIEKKAKKGVKGAMKGDSSDSDVESSRVRLVVKVISGHDLKACDSGGVSDPYVIVRFNKQREWKTQVQKKTVNPTWNETHEFKVAGDIDDFKKGKLHFSVFDEDKMSRDDPMGEAHVTFTNWMMGEQKEMDLTLEEVSKGAIKVHITAMPAGASGAGPQPHAVTHIPVTAAEFAGWKDTVAVTPEGGVLAILVAAYVYTNVNPMEGYQMLVMMTDMQWLAQSPAPGNYKGYVLGGMTHQQWHDHGQPDKAHIYRSYFGNTLPEKGYAMPVMPLTVYLDSTNPHQPENPKHKKIFVVSSGADSSRPVELAQNDKGIWKGYEYSSLWLGVRPPPKNVSDNL